MFDFSFYEVAADLGSWRSSLQRPRYNEWRMCMPDKTLAMGMAFSKH